MGIRLRDRLVESQRLDITAEFTQWIEASASACPWIGDEIIEAVFAGDHHEMSDAAGQSHAHDHRISVRDIRVDEMIRRQVLVDMADAIRREPRRAIPVKSALFRESVRRS